MDANEYYKQLLERQLSFLNINKYHNQGYKGKGITIVNAEPYPGNDGHGEMTTTVIHEYAPEAFVINSPLYGSKKDRFLEIDGQNIELEEAIKKYNIKLFTSSKATAGDDITLNYYKELQENYGVIFLCAAGNYANDGVTSNWAKNNTAIAVGALNMKINGEYNRESYSAIGEELDFMCFMGTGSGTSAASPALASMSALLLQKYGNFNQAECVEILRSLCIRLPGLNNQEQGWGLPILPLTDKLEILEKMRGDKMVFKDVEKDRWSKPAIDKCVEEGLLVGFEDGTFRPTEHVTREQFAIILTRILNKIK